MTTLTYNLRNNDVDSKQYYDDISKFTDLILSEAEDEVYPLIDAYCDYIKTDESEKLRSREEYIYDVISFASVWRIYYPHIRGLSRMEYFILSNLYKARRKFRSVKPYIDKVRGILGTLCLKRNTGLSYKSGRAVKKDFDKTLRWMDATGEYREEVKRVKIFREYFRTLTTEQQNGIMRKLLRFSDLFKKRASEALGKYTPNVNSFISEKIDSYKWKEDLVFCGRKEVEYHLSMFGAEVMNRAFRESYENSGEKALLLPACMKLLPEDKCKAVRESLDSRCTGCSSECRINHFRKEGNERGFSVHIIPHSSDFSRWLETWAAGNNIGVIGVACPLNLITGGLELKSLDIPAQCLLLDYCGCSNHWHKEGIPTDINGGELMNIFRTEKVPGSEEPISA